ncbi:MAG: hypothetical protein IPP98_03875 [Gemmatimonadetes bacterium]|jgi:hypothetical protein|nr:hypothetical protein [Gemmatimonadota bacterium]MBL0178250.1 hypothetical protein [Gemmatimonadota bacterium]
MTRLLLALAALLTVATPASGQLVVQTGERPPRRPEVECTEVFLPAPGDTTRGVYWKPYVRSMVIIKGQPPKKYLDSLVTLTMRVDRRGKVDSTIVTGMPDSGFVRKLRKFSRDLIFVPALYQGCAVSGWASMRFTFGASGSEQRIWPDD